MKFDIKDALKKIGRGKKHGSQDHSESFEGSDSWDSSQDKVNFFGRVGDYFNPEPQKERVLKHEDFKRAGDTYYASVSAFYKIIERLLWLVLAVFLAFSVITNYKEITFDNFFYLLKDFSSASDSDVPDYQVLSYDSDSRQNFELYRGGLVSASPSAVSVFTAGGRRTLKSNTEYYSPNIVSCDKYVLVYDSSGSAFSVYNSFSKVYNEKLESPITDACFAPDGSFAISTKNNDGKTVIYLYGKNLKLRGDISDSRYVLDMSMNSEGDRFCTVSYHAGNGNGVSTLSIYDISSSEGGKKLESIEISGEFPIGCTYLSDGKIAVLTNNSVRIYGKNHNQTEKETFYGADIRAFDLSSQGISVVTGSQSGKNIISFDKKGDLVYNNPIEENISSIILQNNYLFMQTADGVIRLNLKTHDRELLISERGALLVYDDNTAMVCGDARAEYLVFGKKQK